LSGKMQFYDSITHRSLFSLPLYLRRALEEQRQIITDGNPVFFHQR